MRFIMFGLVSLGVACGANPCDEYVELECQCVDAQECDDKRATFENADVDQQDECSAQLDAAETRAQDRCEDEQEQEG